MLSLFAGIQLLAAPPVPFSGKLAVDGKNFHGNALFAFSLVDGEGAVHWKHANEPDARIENFVMNGRYLVLLGGQGMQTLPADLFLKHDSLFLRVSVDLKDGKGLRLLEPDQRITSSPYALSSEIARLAEKASVADGVTPGAITAGMIDTGLLADLNRTAGITEITRDMLPLDVRNDLNRTITKSMLSQEVLNELNSSSGGGGVVPGSLLAVPANQSAPSGYSLYSEGEPKELVWEEKASFSDARGFLGAMLQESPDNLIYAIGGHVNPSTSFNKVEAYNPNTDSWSVKANLSETSFGQATTSFDSKIYVMGGYDLSKVEIYDPSSNQWSLGTQIPIATRYASSVSLNSKIFILGGRQSPSTILNKVYSFDSVQNSWTEKAHLQTPRAGHRSVVFNGQIWVIGGSNLSDVFKSVEIYDHVNDAWSYGPDLKINRQGFSCWTWGNKLFLAGGFNETGILDSIEVYDNDSGAWRLYGTLPTPNKYSMATVLNNKIYLYGGEINDTVYSNKLYAADLNASVSGVFDLYRKDGNASSGVPVAQVADGSITTTQLSEQILKYLKPEITQQPTASTIFADTNHTLSVSAEGKYLTYQWKKNGANLAGETNATLTITDANSTQHEGNYTVVVSNDFGSVESGEAEILIKNSPLSFPGIELWLDASDAGSLFSDTAMTSATTGSVAAWADKSGNNFNLTQSTTSKQPSYDVVNRKVSFNNQYLTATPPTMSQPITSFIVLEFSGSNTDTQYVHDSTVGRFILGESSSTGFGLYSTTASENTSWLQNSSFSPVNKSVMSYSHNGENSYLYHNGTLILNGTVGNDALAGTFSIGVNHSLSDAFFNGSIYEFVIYSGSLATNTRQILEGYLAHKHSLESELPTDHPYK